MPRGPTVSRRAAPVPATALYETPAGVVAALAPLLPCVGTMIDLGAGNGRIVDGMQLHGVARAAVACEPDTTRAGSRAGSRAVDRGITIRREPFVPGEHLPFDLVVSNPPFCDATAWARSILYPEIPAPSQTVALLVRVGWYRAAAHALPPCDLHLLDPRPSFTPDGRTDGSEYAWCIWGPGRGGRFSVLTWRDVRGRT